MCLRWPTVRELGLCSNADTPVSCTGTFRYKIVQPQERPAVVGTVLLIRLRVVADLLMRCFM